MTLGCLESGAERIERLNKLQAIADMVSMGHPETAYCKHIICLLILVPMQQWGKKSIIVLRMAQLRLKHQRLESHGLFPETDLASASDTSAFNARASATAVPSRAKLVSL